ncbi:MAG: hypothetical protein A3H82_00095 [Candidatus Levybacteria bacterium RIFCSPLOWO2_02_FULL_39_26]|nr:MAG: hypothetical protein A3H82_00095 [Candidatus Levybacteria bacterium RIFCSPLOWO2_02_FULL_39_26]
MREICPFVNDGKCPVREVLNVKSYLGKDAEGLSAGVIRALVCMAELEQETRKKECGRYTTLSIKQTARRSSGK